MSRRNLPLWIVPILFLLVGLACSSSPAVPVTGPDLVGTAAYATVGAQMTQEAFNNLVQVLTQAAEKTATFTPVPPTATETATATSTRTPTATLTNTPVPPTVTNTPVPTNTPIPCYRVQFIADITAADGTIYSQNQGFVKTWRLRNVGSCTWTSDFDLVFISGNAMGANSAVDTNATVAPGNTVDYSIAFTAPGDTGTYTGNWEMRSPNGVIFGLGPNGDKPFWVKIGVQSQTSTAVSTGSWNSDHKGEFVYNVCSASWSSAWGALGCPSSSENFTTGAVFTQANPRLEGGYQENETALVTIPSSGDGGTITGVYPALAVTSGMKFTAMVGCLYNSPKCNATLLLNYSADGGTVQNLGTWTEISDGTFHHISVDVSSLAGKSVQFYLKVNNNGDSTDDRIFWIAAKVQ
jgi:hypothetical protein